VDKCKLLFNVVACENLWKILFEEKLLGTRVQMPVGVAFVHLWHRSENLVLQIVQLSFVKPVGYYLNIADETYLS